MTDHREPPPRYRVNRRAALVTTAVFLVIGVVLLAVFRHRFSPRHQLEDLRASARHHLDRKEWAAAAIHLSNLVRLAPGEAQSWRDLGAAQLRLVEARAEGGSAAGRLTQAADCFRRAAELQPDHLPTQRWLLELAIRGGGDDREGEQRLTAVRRLSPADPLVPVAEELLAARRRDRVSNASRELDRTDSRRGRVARTEMLATAQAVLDTLAIDKVDPVDLRRLTPIASARVRLGQSAAALDLVDRAEARLGATPGVRLLRCGVLAETGWLAETPESSARALRDAERLLSELLDDSVHGRPARLLAAQVLAAQAERADEPAARRAGMARALEALEPLVRMADPVAINNSAWILGVELGRTREALERLDAAAAPTERRLRATLADTRASLLLREFRFAEAAEQARMVMELDPDDRLAEFRHRVALVLTRIAKSMEIGPRSVALGGAAGSEAP